MFGIGIDVGGTTIKLGLVNNKGEILCRKNFSTPKLFSELVSLIIEGVNKLLDSANISIKEIIGIGIACPGMISDDGIIIASSNFEFENAPLKEELLKTFNTKIIIDNDANVATLAEKEYGVAKDYDNAILLTLGTGVGGGVILNGKLFNGANNSGVELGHFTLVYGGEKCGCGRRGCFEQYASANALIRDAKKAMLNDKDSAIWKAVKNNLENLNAKIIFEEAKKGDKTAIKVVDKFIEYLSNGIMSLNNVYRPDIFIIGGGISAQGEYLTNKINQYCAKYYYGYKGIASPKITTAILGNDAGIIGAFSLVK